MIEQPIVGNNDSRLEIVEFNSQKLQNPFQAGYYTFSTVILRDKNTNVLYMYVNNGSIIPMIDANGKPLIYGGE